MRSVDLDVANRAVLIAGLAEIVERGRGRGTGVTLQTLQVDLRSVEETRVGRTVGLVARSTTAGPDGSVFKNERPAHRAVALYTVCIVVHGSCMQVVTIIALCGGMFVRSTEFRSGSRVTA